MTGVKAAATTVVLLRVDRAADRHTRHPRHLHPALDLKYIEAALTTAPNVVPVLLDGWLTPFCVDRMARTVLDLAPRIAVLRAVSWCLEESVALGARLRQAGVITVAVGQQVEHAQRVAVPGWSAAFDLCLAGEPESLLPALLTPLITDLHDGCAPAEALARTASRLKEAGQGVVDAPDCLPLPRYSAEELAAYPFPFPLPGHAPRERWGYVLTSWGCPRTCQHCTALVRRSVDRRLRTRAIASVVDEVEALRDAGADALYFEDDSLFVHKAHALALADMLIRRNINLPWLANARPDELDAERVAAAKGSGAALLKVGVDTGSPRLIEAIGKARNGEAWVAATQDSFARLRTQRIGSVAMLTVGLPGETEADAERSLALALRCHPDYLQVQAYRAYPDVALWPDLPESVRRQAANGEYHYAKGSNCSAMADERLDSLAAQFYRRYYFRPAFVAWHLRHSWRHYGSLAGMRQAAAWLRFLVRRPIACT